MTRRPNAPGADGPAALNSPPAPQAGGNATFLVPASGAAPPPAPTPSVWTPAVLVAPLVVLLAAFGLWMVWGGRLAPVGRDPDASPWRAVRWRDRLTEASRLSIGLAALFVAYHALSYALPHGWLPFRIPPEKWYILAIGVVLLVGGSLAVDRVLASDAPADGGGHEDSTPRDG